MPSSIVEPQLAPPGAGIPWWELMWVRPTFRAACVLFPASWATNRFRREGTQLLATIMALPPEAACRRVLIRRVAGIEDSSRFWSACMVLEHLCIVNRTITDIIEALSRGAAFAREIHTADVKPSPDTGLDVIGRFEQTMRDYIARVDLALRIRSTVRHPHPWFGPLTARQWHLLAAIHHILHRRQLALIIRGVAGA